MNPDSTQLIQSNTDTIIKITHDTIHQTIVNNMLIPSTNGGDPAWLKFFIAPACLVLFSVWLAGYINRLKEYNRLKKLDAFVNVWLNNVASGITDQIKVFYQLQETYRRIDYSSRRVFNYANPDIKSIVEIPKEDLYKLFISIRPANATSKSENLYDLLFALNSVDTIIKDYKSQLMTLNQETIDLSNDFTKAVLNLHQAEKIYANSIHASTKVFKSSNAFGVYDNLKNLIIERENYLLTGVRRTRTKIIHYAFAKKMIEFIEDNKMQDQDLLPLLELNLNIVMATYQVLDYYGKIRVSFALQMVDLGRMNNKITTHQKYFNNLKFFHWLKLIYRNP